MSQRIKLWDLPTRLFHWLLVILIAAAIITGNIGGGLMQWHGRIGLAILGLIVFRIVWGLLGSTYSRFSSFLPVPSRVIAYLRGNWHGIGHNPLGAFSVFGLLGLVALQAGTGIFANDDIAFNGPLYALIGKDLSDTLTGIHKLSINVLIALIVLHLAAIVFYTHVKKDNLIKPMITGWKEIKPGAHEEAKGGGLVAFIVALLIAAAAVYGAAGYWIPPPPAPPPTAAPTTPAW